MPARWYQDGLQFTCTQCGRCCTGPPGFVWVDDRELTKIAMHLDQPRAEVLAMHTRLHDGRRSLREKINGDCVLYDAAAGCTIYEVRPKQCRTYPFWESTVGTPEGWDKVKLTCPGAGTGELISEQEITKRVRKIRI